MIRYIKLSRKWTIFLALNYLTLIPTGIIIQNYIPHLFNRQDEELLFSALLLLQLMGVIFNNCVSIYAINRYFPDKLLSKEMKALLNVTIIFDLTALITLIAVILTGLNDSTIYLKENTTRAIVILSCLLLFLILIIYFVYLRLQIGGYLKKEFEIRKMTDEIGKDAGS